MDHAGSITISARPKAKGERLAILGLYLFGVPNLLTLLVFGSFMLFAVLLDLDIAPADSSAEGTALGGVLFAALGLAMLAAHVGLAMLLWALFVSKLRVRWFYYAMQVTTVFMLFSAGSILLTLVVSRYLHTIRDEFRDQDLKVQQQAGEAPKTETAVPPMPTADTPVRSTQLEEENERLRRIVAAQSLEIQKLKEITSRE